MAGVSFLSINRRTCARFALLLGAMAIGFATAGISPAFNLISPAVAAQDKVGKKTKIKRRKSARKRREKRLGKRSAKRSVKRSGKRSRRVTAIPRLRGLAPSAEASKKPAVAAPARRERDREKKSAGDDAKAREAKDKPDARTEDVKPGKVEKPGKTDKPVKAEGGADKPARKTAPAGKPGKGVNMAAPAELLGTKLLQRLAGAYRKSTKALIKFQAMNPDKLNAQVKRGLIDAAILSRGANDADPAGGALSAFQPVFYVDLYVVGPAADPADIKGMVSLPDAMRAIAQSRSTFLAAPLGHSLNRLERRVWKEAGVQPIAGRDRWYIATAGLPAMSTLDLLIKASQQRYYMIADKATWLESGLANRKDRNLRILVRDDPRLQLVYGIAIRGNSKAPGAATRFREWLTGESAAKVINSTSIQGAKPYLAEHGLRR